VLLADLVTTLDAVAADRSRNAKVSLMADVLVRVPPEEVRAAVGLLAGEARQGRIGVGWATVLRLENPPEPAAEPSVTVTDLDRALDRLQGTTGKGSVAERAALLRDLLGRATAAEGDFIRRLLIGEVRQGALEGIVAEAVARAAQVPAARIRRASMLAGDLGRVAEIALRDPAGLDAVALVLLQPLQPMLAATAPGVEEALAATGLASVEWKLDGVRIQVHRSGNEVRVFTRNLNDVTGRVPEVVAIVSQFPADRLVLDGEAIGLDDAERPRLFQDTMSRVGRRSGEPELSLVPWFFDLLHAEGEDLLDRPLLERREALERVAGPWRIPSIVTDEAAQAQRLLDDALAAGHEGVMVKGASSTYEAGRRGKAWLKVKPVRTLDLVVLGAEWGHGRRRGWLSNLHLGARDPAGGFVMVGKTFKGLTDETLRLQTERFLAIESSRDGITVFVRPEIVVEIALDGVQASTRYPGGVALRFARVLRYRPDKTARDADTIEAVRSLLPRAGGGG
jgi:DNA ligase-1